jgi:hypothetical protein
MYLRILVFIAAVLGLTWSAVLVGGRAGAQSGPVVTIEQQLANQRLLINQLQTRLTAVEQRSPAGPVKATTPAIAAPHFVRPKTALADMGPGLATLQAQHLQFVKLNPAAASSGPDLAAQVAALTKEVSTLKTELSVDETVIFGELTLVRNNVNTVDSDTTTVYGDAVQAAWLACVDYGHQGIEFAGWTQLDGTQPAPCFAPGY